MSKDDKEKKSCFYEAFEYIKKALELNDQNFAVHKVHCTSGVRGQGSGVETAVHKVNCTSGVRGQG